MTTTITASGKAEGEAAKHCSLSEMDEGKPPAADADDGRPVFYRKMNGGQGTSENRPKSGKVLVRKNTPALLPKVDKIYAKDMSSHESVLTEEDEESCPNKKKIQEDDQSSEACAN